MEACDGLNDLRGEGRASESPCAATDIVCNKRFVVLLDPDDLHVVYDTVADCPAMLDGRIAAFSSLEQASDAASTLNERQICHHAQPDRG